MGDATTGLARRIGELRTELVRRDPARTARACGARFDGRRLHIPVWGADLVVDPGDFVARSAATGEPADDTVQALLAYYLFTADGSRPAGSWIAFSDLPDGRFYARAFQGYTGNVLGRCFAGGLDAFHSAARRLGGTADGFAAVAYCFQVLPFVPLLVAVWLGDDEFPTTFRLLFDAHVSHHLPTDACAILGSTLTRRLCHEAGC